MNVWKKIISQNVKYGKVGKLPVFLVIACLLLLVACAPTAKPGPDPDPEPTEYNPEDFRDVEILDAVQLYQQPIEKVYFNGEIVDYEQVKENIKYPYFHTVLTKEEIEKGYEESIKRILKLYFISGEMLKESKYLTSFSGQSYDNLDAFLDFSDKLMPKISAFEKECGDGKFGEKFKKYVKYDPVLKMYFSDFKFYEITNSIEDKEYFFRWSQTMFQLELELLKEEGIEYDPIAFQENPLQFKLVI